MGPKRYVPERGDVVWLQFNPQVGHEQAGHRPALVLSPLSYNKRTGLMLCCPITSRVKGYPFETRIKSKDGVDGIVLADQVKSLDWKVRRAKKKSRVPPSVINDVLAKARTLLS
ncbi:MAG: endoribonuclease MazF [Nitrospira sp.]